jgi:ADP-ribose pyrophosphatase YjhB (NUDIX family)
MKTCDHKSVGVVIIDQAGRFLLLTRAKPPAGRAPVAGHVDEHGDFEHAGIVESMEEVGLHVDHLTHLAQGHLPNICRRPPSHATHDGHDWVIYRTYVRDDHGLAFSEDEARGGGWYTAVQLQELAERTILWATGKVSDAGYNENPGLEPVWVHWMTRLGYTRIGPRSMDAIEATYSRVPAA